MTNDRLTTFGAAMADIDCGGVATAVDVED